MMNEKLEHACLFLVMNEKRDSLVAESRREAARAQRTAVLRII